MNINDYTHLKKDIQDLCLKQNGVDIVYNYTIVSAAIHVPTIVCAFFVGEVLNWPKELVDNIAVLTKTYSYNLIGVPEGFPGEKV
jgi:hypothetical protein